MSDYVAHIRGPNATPHQVHDHYYGVRRFVVWLQRVEHPLAPTRLADRLFDPNIAARPPR
jgi:hypothetical protein